MRQSSVVIAEGREDVNTIAGALKQISMAVSEAATRSEEIFHGADSHSLNAQSMVSAIEEIAKVASGNGQSISELGVTMSGQLRAVDDIYRSAESVSRLAVELETSLTIFQTGSGQRETLSRAARGIVDDVESRVAGFDTVGEDT
jgi:methyl-accepting chemotaxis protein